MEAVAGLAREVDGLRRQFDTVADLPVRVEALTRSVAELSDAVEALAALPSRPGPTPAPSWLSAPADPEVTSRLVEGLVAWLRAVFLRYPDGQAALPECWLWHPEVVEELLWLMHAWLAAYQGRGASVQAAGDWHDRQRPGVVRRLRASVASCSRENHQTRAGWSQTPSGPVSVPGLDAVASITDWWAHHREQPPPEPAPASTGNGAHVAGAHVAGGPQTAGWSR